MILDPKTQPVVKVRIESAACRFEVRINDVLVFRNLDGLPLTADFPVSESMLSGPNVLSARMLPPGVFREGGEELLGSERYDPGSAFLKLSLLVKPNGAPRSEQRTLATLELVSPDPGRLETVLGATSPAGRFDSRADLAKADQGDVLVSRVCLSADDEKDRTQGISASRRIELSVPCPAWRWCSGEILSNSDETRMSLLTAYREWWRLLRQRDAEAIQRAMRVKTEEFAAAYYLGTEAEANQVMGITELALNESLELQDYDDADLHLELEGDGRLARLVDTQGDSPIVFVEDQTIGHYLVAKFSRLADGLVLVR